MSDVRPVVAVTGAAQGIGRRAAEVLAGLGYALAITDIQPLDDTASAPSLADTQVLASTGDIADEAFVRSWSQNILRHFGHVDCVVNNAGVSSILPAEDISAKEWRRVMEVNLFAPFVVCREFGRAMLSRGRGCIVNVASVAGLLGISHRAAYNTSKHGLIGLTRTLAAEWGGRGVRVNAVCPGWVKTPMDDSATAAGLYDDSDIEGRIPMHRFATVDDIANAIAFLADDRSAGFINGHCLAVDGGWTSDGSWQSLRDQAWSHEIA